MTVTDIADLDADEATGYATHDTYFCTRLVQGGREMFSIDLSIPQLVATVPRPDPLHPIEGNRRIDASRAKAFAHYVRHRRNWVCPTITLRAPSGEFHFEGKLSTPAAGGTEFGTLSIPRLSRNMLFILDGQHRTLGFHMLWEELMDELSKTRSRKARHRNEGDAEMAQALDKKLREIQKERDQLSKERVQVVIMVVDDPRDYRQVFYDIADNAKGISGAVKVRFDTTKVVNRALDTVIHHPLLDGRVEMESDRISGPYLLGAKHVSDIIRAMQVGAAGRITRRLEDELNDDTVTKDALDFFSTLTLAFPEMQAVQDGTLSPKELRDHSLLGSSTFLRVLAGTTRALVERGIDIEHVIHYFASLRPFLRTPIGHDSPLLLTSCFQPGTSAPSARMGDVTKLEQTLTEWAINPPSFLVDGQISDSETAFSREAPEEGTKR